MNTPSQQRLFLERRSYQRRRLIDALRLLPVLGVLLWLVPLVWAKASAGDAPVSIVSASGYVFAVWAILIVLGALIARRIEFGAETGDQDPASSIGKQAKR